MFFSIQLYSQRRAYFYRYKNITDLYINDFIYRSDIICNLALELSQLMKVRRVFKLYFALLFNYLVLT